MQLEAEISTFQRIFPGKKATGARYRRQMRPLQGGMQHSWLAGAHEPLGASAPKRAKVWSIRRGRNGAGLCSLAPAATPATRPPCSRWYKKRTHLVLLEEERLRTGRNGLVNEVDLRLPALAVALREGLRELRGARGLLLGKLNLVDEERVEDREEDANDTARDNQDVHSDLGLFVASGGKGAGPPGPR